MARLSFNEAEARINNSGNGQQGNYTQTLYLKDKESAFVLSLLKDVTDVEVHSVHKVKFTSKNGKDYMIDVDCLGKGCPLCKEATKYQGEKFPAVTKARDMVYVPVVRLYNYEGEFEPSYCVISRSTKWYRNTYVEAATRFDMDKPLEIIRSGKGVDTTWSIYPAGKVNGEKIPDVNANQLIEDLEIDVDSSISGTPTSVVRTWDADQMEMYIETGQWPNLNNNSDEAEEEEEEQVKPRGNNKYGF